MNSQNNSTSKKTIRQTRRPSAAKPKTRNDRHEDPSRKRGGKRPDTFDHKPNKRTRSKTKDAQKPKKRSEENEALYIATSKYRNDRGRTLPKIETKKTSKDQKTKQKDTSRSNQQRHRDSKRRTKKPHTEARNTGELLRILPLGGLKEIGKNITLIEFRNDILIVDCGFSFPEDEMFGIDVVIPDFTYLKENRHKIRGLIITHGHEDHIGGVPFLLKEIDVPVYASPLAMGLIRNKLKEHGITMKEHVLHAGDVIQIGSFRVEAIRTNHSIADSFAYSIRCDCGHIVHTGDFKIDYSPLDGKRIDLARFAELGSEGVDVLLCDSTNVLRSGYTPSERIVVDSMNDIFEKTEKRIIIATFSSNIYRIKYFMEASIRHGRKIAISGRSMENVTALAKELGYLDLPETAFVDIREISQIPDANLTIVTTGSQGEPMSALTRMANDVHRAVKLKAGDTVVFSSSPIPGNQKAVTNVVNKLYEKKVNVFLSDFVDVHVSGHACKEELKLMHTLLHPRFFIPAHGEYRHLFEHSKLAESLGMNSGHIFIMNNGDAFELRGKQAKVVKNFAPAEDVLVDGYGIGDVGNVVLRDRKQLSEGGLIVIAVSIDDATNELASAPELITRGFIYVKDNMPLINEAKSVVYETMSRCHENGYTDSTTIKNALRDDMRGFIYRKTKRSPVILPVILYV